jgi:hypothetical protein
MYTPGPMTQSGEIFAVGDIPGLVSSTKNSAMARANAKRGLATKMKDTFARGARPSKDGINIVSGELKSGGSAARF